MVFLAESLMGIMLILMGLLVGRFPNMINIFSAEEDRKSVV